MFKESQNSIEDEDMSNRPTMSNTQKMVNSVNALILINRRVTIEDISEQVGIFVGTAHKIVYDDLAFSKVSCHWVSLDNERSHIAARTVETICQFSREQLPQPLYCPDLAPCLAHSKNFFVEESFQVMMMWRAPWENG